MTECSLCDSLKSYSYFELRDKASKTFCFFFFFLTILIMKANIPDVPTSLEVF